MIALEITVNGNRICVAGGSLVTSTSISWSDRDGAAVRLNIGGIEDPTLREHLHWNAPGLEIGDEVTIRILSTDDVDPPLRYIPANRPIQDPF